MVRTGFSLNELFTQIKHFGGYSTVPDPDGYETDPRDIEVGKNFVR